MKTRILFILFFVAHFGFSQTVNDYKAVIVPVKYDFLKSENQYRLSTLTKANLLKAGFKAFYSNEPIPLEFSNRCEVLNIDVKEDKAFLLTKLYIVFKDCYGKVVFQSETGKSKEKEFQVAYAEALNNAFLSVYDLGYSYTAPAKAVVNAEPKVTTVVDVATVPVTTTVPVNADAATLLYAQATTNGYNLIDSEPKIVMKIYKTSVKDYFTAVKGTINGVLLLKDNQWVFEYYQNDQLVSETVQIKF